MLAKEKGLEEAKREYEKKVELINSQFGIAAKLSERDLKQIEEDFRSYDVEYEAKMAEANACLETINAGLPPPI